MKNKKILGTKSYGSIPHLLGSKLGEGDHHIHEGQHNILTKKTRDRHDTIIVTEKYDGSNVSIANHKGKIYALTRSGYEAHTSPYKQHHAFSDYVKMNLHLFEGKLNEGERLCCEWLFKRHSLAYGYSNYPFAPIVCFDLISKKHPAVRLPFMELINRRFAIPHARILHIGSAVSIKEMVEKVNNGTYEVQCLEKPEGFVYRVERNGNFDFCAKWVRSDFEAGKYLEKNNRKEATRSK